MGIWQYNNWQSVATAHYNYAKQIGGLAYTELLGCSCPPSLELQAYDYRDEADGTSPLMTFTRASAATQTNAQGVIESVIDDVMRHDYDPDTGEYKGWLIEESRTNVLLNALIDGTNLVTQSVTTTAIPYTLSFFGSGSITLSGTDTTVLTGTGDYPNKSALTFTPSAGTLTLTVEGDVKYTQLEAGSSATSFIPTAGAAVTRAADVCSIESTDFTDFYNQDEGTLVSDFNMQSVDGIFPVVSFHAGTTSDIIRIIVKTGILYVEVRTGGVWQTALNLGTITDNTDYKCAVAYKSDSISACLNTGSVLSDTSALLPTVNTMELGTVLHIKSQVFFPRAFDANILQLLTQ